MELDNVTYLTILIVNTVSYRHCGRRQFPISYMPT